MAQEKPRIERIARPWIARRFIDSNVDIICVPFNEVKDKARL